LLREWLELNSKKKQIKDNRMANFLQENTFTLSGGREMVDENRINELLSAASPDIGSPPPSSITGINLSNKSFSHSAALILANYLKQFPNLKRVDLSDIIAGRHEDEALLVLETLCNSINGSELLEVNVSDNALGRKGIIACQNILKGKLLQKVYFCNNGLSAEASEYITEIFLSSSSSPPPLEVLHFYNNMSGTVGAQSSAMIVSAIGTTLKDFRYSATRSGKEGCLPIAQALCQTSELTNLDLSDNSFGDEVTDILVEVITRQVTLPSSLTSSCIS
jgi:Ran GTPase-activating protein 1